MGFFSKLFSSTEIATDIVKSTISAGDKLVYTDEEKADMKMKVLEYWPTLLGAYAPFKLAQRYLALIFTSIFAFAFISGVFMTFYNIYAKYQFKEKAELLDISQLISIVEAFSLDYIMLVIVSFYFMGGTIESFKRAKEGK